MLRLLALLIALIVPIVLLALTSPREGAPPRADNAGQTGPHHPVPHPTGRLLRSADDSSSQGQMRPSRAPRIRDCRRDCTHTVSDAAIRSGCIDSINNVADGRGGP